MLMRDVWCARYWPLSPARDPQACLLKSVMLRAPMNAVVATPALSHTLTIRYVLPPPHAYTLHVLPKMGLDHLSQPSLHSSAVECVGGAQRTPCCLNPPAPRPTHTRRRLIDMGFGWGSPHGYTERVGL